jgi:hypothetical protein
MRAGRGLVTRSCTVGLTKDWSDAVGFFGRRPSRKQRISFAAWLLRVHGLADQRQLLGLLWVEEVPSAVSCSEQSNRKPRAVNFP